MLGGCNLAPPAVGYLALCPQLHGRSGVLDVLRSWESHATAARSPEPAPSQWKLAAEVDKRRQYQGRAHISTGRTWLDGQPASPPGGSAFEIPQCSDNEEEDLAGEEGAQDTENGPKAVGRRAACRNRSGPATASRPSTDSPERRRERQPTGKRKAAEKPAQPQRLGRLEHRLRPRSCAPDYYCEETPESDGDAHGGCSKTRLAALREGPCRRRLPALHETQCRPMMTLVRFSTSGQ